MTGEDKNLKEKRGKQEEKGNQQQYPARLVTH